MIVQDLLRNFSCFPVRRELSSGPHHSIRSPAKLQPRHRRRSTDRALTSPRKEWAETRFLLYRLRTLRLFGGCLSIPSFLCISFRPDLKKYINIAMRYGIAFKVLRGERHTSDSSLKSTFHFQTSTTARFGK